jgi:site-specific DNA recombinase
MNDGLKLRQTIGAASPIRCAIYTRKSTEEGLDQDFNSLEAQREAAIAYIQSQKHLGWIAVADHYDDGGFSGGNLDRPALQHLLDDIEARRVDCVVVYKVDRLSRSLLDFARLMDRFDQRSVSFVSVTQHFNTTTSLGRLTLNILLSFAQFERELISERTRDKMSAARRKGKWVGGTPVLGYDVDPRGGRLVVNEKEAQIVREIFEMYRRHRSLDSVVRELTRLGWKTKSWKSKRGLRHKGRLFTAISLNRLLTNQIYAGKVEYRGAIYDGEHAAIVKPELFAEISADLQEPKRTKPNSVGMPQKALLAGLLFCKSCDHRMIATYSINQGVRYRYYVCRGVRQNGWRSCASKSVRATLIEDSVVAQLCTRLSEKQARLTLQIPDPAWEAFLQGDRELVRALVEIIRYDGNTGTVSVRLRRLETSEFEAQP